MVVAGHVTYTDRFHELARLVPYLVTPKNKRIERYIYGLAPQIQGMMAATEPTTIRKVVQMAGILTDEANRNGSLKMNLEKRGNRGEPSKDRNGRDDNKRTRTRNAFATTTNPVRRENMGTAPKCTTCNFHHPPETPCRTCFNGNRPGHFAKDCRVVSRNVNPINAGNPTSRTCYECGSTDHFKAACPRFNQAQRSGENHQNQVVVVNGDQGRGNNGNQACGRAFMLGVEEARPDLNIMTVRIPLLDRKVLRVLGERPEEKARHLMSAKEHKQEEMVVIELVPGAILVMKSPYQLAPSEMVELSGQLKELQDKGFIRPSSSPWGASEMDIQEQDKKKAKNKQSRARNGKDKVKPKPKSVKIRKSTPTKSKVNQVKKIQLEGLKLSNLKLYY
ncbi:putative reverse transcriptase domain-containing protein [Tanacetum coccineum]|uniref:Reverse transcriptase domain-containing protein n=1 Tax=Tanacetum coccineum TaxID=301880 RepID=A0ABQ5INP6_9ASTR